MIEQNCKNCLHGPECDKDECSMHPKNYIPCLWEPTESEYKNLCGDKWLETGKP